jgi:hypothetical protein
MKAALLLLAIVCASAVDFSSVDFINMV